MTRVTVIVVSRGRPDLLRLCVTAIGQLCHRAFEVVVVADAGGVAAVRHLGQADRLKLLQYDEANISSARNLGLSVAAGEVVAFIDDDAVPEPTWLCHLTAPFEDTEVAATGGYVLGRNGIGLQWGARAVNRLGETVALQAPGDDPFEPAPPRGFVGKVEGTNCAFRRDVLAGLGGFDPAFRYYLDETDVILRLAAAGGRTVLVPRALVHHGFAASDSRAADRSPRDLTEIGASTAVFLRKHADAVLHDAALSNLAAAQRRRLLGHMVAGGLEPRDVDRLLEGLSAGVRTGFAREIAALVAIAPATAPFLTFPGERPAESVHIAGRTWQGGRLRQAAAEAVRRGQIATVFRFGPTARRHRVRFRPGGWWEQTGGIFGAADRDEPAFRIAGFRGRVAREWARIAAVRRCR